MENRCWPWKSKKVQKDKTGWWDVLKAAITADKHDNKNIKKLTKGQPGLIVELQASASAVWFQGHIFPE